MCHPHNLTDVNTQRIHPLRHTAQQKSPAWLRTYEKKRVTSYRELSSLSKQLACSFLVKTRDSLAMTRFFSRIFSNGALKQIADRAVHYIMSSSVSDLLLQVASEQRDHSCVAALASGLTPLELAELLDDLRAAGRHSQQHVFALCRLLLSLERTREDAIITCVKLFHDQRIRDKAGLSCLSEVRAAIVQRASASDDPQAAVATVAFLQRVCDAILSFLSDSGLADKSAAQVSGHIQALELLPTVLDCADSALHLPGGRGVWQQLEEVRTSTVRRVLETRWPAHLLLPLFTALSEVELTHRERHVVYSKVEDGLIAEDAAAASTSRVDLNSSVVGLIQVAT